MIVRGVRDASDLKHETRNMRQDFAKAADNTTILPLPILWIVERGVTDATRISSTHFRDFFFDSRTNEKDFRKIIAPAALDILLRARHEVLPNPALPQTIQEFNSTLSAKLGLF